jgi:acetyl esterase/lipase
VRRLSVIVAIPLCFAANRLDPAHLEAIHSQRVEWMKKRAVLPAQGVYHDYRAVTLGDTRITDAILKAARTADVQILLRPGDTEVHAGVLFTSPTGELPTLSPRAADVKNLKELQGRFKQYPDEVFDAAGEQLSGDHYDLAFRHSTTHILAAELTAAAIESSLLNGRAYAAHDWLCDPLGLSFVAENNLGVFEIGDTAPLTGRTRLVVELPIRAKIKILRDKTVVAEADESRLTYIVKETGAYRLEASLSVDGQDQSWIITNPIRFGPPPNLILPSGANPAEVEVKKEIAYVDDGHAKHKLDLYLPKGKQNFPVMVFYHGGSWRSGDRSLYAPLGERFAKAGIGVVVPSYRLMPADPHPAQIEDAAAAFAWVGRTIAQFGGDASRIYIAGHSSGGHLVSLLALDPAWLKKYDISPGTIRGVVSISGVYDVEGIGDFKNRNASPLQFVHPRVPPFLITFCQWDYLGLPKQARDFSAALRKEFADVKLRYIPGESHISEIIATLKDDDPTARAILEFIK